MIRHIQCELPSLFVTLDTIEQSCTQGLLIDDNKTRTSQRHITRAIVTIFKVKKQSDNGSCYAPRRRRVYEMDVSRTGTVLTTNTDIHITYSGRSGSTTSRQCLLITTTIQAPAAIRLTIHTQPTTAIAVAPWQRTAQAKTAAGTIKVTTS